VTLHGNAQLEQSRIATLLFLVLGDCIRQPTSGALKYVEHAVGIIFLNCAQNRHLLATPDTLAASLSSALNKSGRWSGNALSGHRLRDLRRLLLWFDELGLDDSAARTAERAKLGAAFNTRNKGAQLHWGATARTLRDLVVHGEKLHPPPAAI
jgi:hypothetical protein